MKHKMKALLAALLAVCMIGSLIPAEVFAAEIPDAIQDMLQKLADQSENDTRPTKADESTLFLNGENGNWMFTAQKSQVTLIRGDAEDPAAPVEQLDEAPVDGDTLLLLSEDGYIFPDGAANLVPGETTLADLVSEAGESCLLTVEVLDGRYALNNGGSYLTADADGIAVFDDNPVWFDLTAGENGFSLTLSTPSPAEVDYTAEDDSGVSDNAAPAPDEDATPDADVEDANDPYAEGPDALPEAAVPIADIATAEPYVGEIQYLHFNSTGWEFTSQKDHVAYIFKLTEQTGEVETYTAETKIKIVTDLSELSDNDKVIIVSCRENIGNQPPRVLYTGDGMTNQIGIEAEWNGVTDPSELDTIGHLVTANGNFNSDSTLIPHYIFELKENPDYDKDDSKQFAIKSMLSGETEKYLSHEATQGSSGPQLAFKDNEQEFFYFAASSAKYPDGFYITIGEAGYDKFAFGDVFDGTTLDNTWVITGGVGAAGGLEQTGGMRNYAGHFEENIRWVNRAIGGNDMAGRNRFVINTGKDGQTIQDLLDKFDDRIGNYHPRAVAILVGDEEVAGTDSAKLKQLVEKCLELRDNNGFVVLQTLGDEAKALVEQVKTEIDADPGKASRFLAVNHDDVSNTERALTEEDHQKIAQKLALETIGDSNIGEIWDVTQVDAPKEYGTSAGSAPQVSGASNSLTVTVSDPGSWVYYLMLPETQELVSGTLTSGAPTEIDGLPANAPFTLIVRSDDGEKQLPAVSGIVAASTEKPATLTAAQQKVKSLVERMDQQATWLFMGDSITHGAQHTHGYDSVPQLFEEYLHDVLGRKDDVVVNTAVSGADSGTTLGSGTQPYLQNRLKDFASASPDVVIIQLGTNDTGLTNDTETYKNNMQTILAAVEETCPDAVIVLRCPSAGYDRGTYGAIYGPVLKQIAETDESKYIYVDQYSAMAQGISDYSWLSTYNGSTPLFGNALHPGPEGHLIMFKYLLDGLGLWNWDNEMANLRYDFTGISEEECDIKPALQQIDGGIRLSLTGLAGIRPGGALLASATITAVGEDGTVYRTRARGAEQELKLENLPQGTYEVTVSAYLHDQAIEVTYAKQTFEVVSDAPEAPTGAQRDSESVAVENGAAPGGMNATDPFKRNSPSANYRIPALITLKGGTHEGRLIAGTDARWSTTVDAGGHDTLIALSDDNGDSWNYHFVNFFGDTTNVYNKFATMFIDPALTADDQGNVYLLADLFPGGGAIAGAYQTPIPNETGYVKIGSSGNEDPDGGTLRLVLYDSPNASVQQASDWQYYIGEFSDGYAPVCQKGTTDPSYYVDQWYYLYTSDKQPMVTYQISGDNGSAPVYSDKIINANVFFWAPAWERDKLGETDQAVNLHVQMVNFLTITKSTDGGETWGAPEIISDQVRGNEPAGNYFFGAGPGNGLVASDGTVYFCYYTHTGYPENTGIIYRDKDTGKWHSSGSLIQTQSSEASLAELDGKVYLFARQMNGYAIYDKQNDSWTMFNAAEDVPPGIYHGCQLSVIAYSQKINDKSAVILSAPSGSGRQNGKIWIGLCDPETGKITWGTTYEINKTSFAYSCVTEVLDSDDNATENNSIGLLYEGPGSSEGKEAEEFVIIHMDELVDENASVGGVINLTAYLYETTSFNLDGVNYEDIVPVLEQFTTNLADVKASPGSENHASLTITGKVEGSTHFTVGDKVIHITVKPRDLHTYTLQVGQSWECPNRHTGLETATVAGQTDRDVVQYDLKSEIRTHEGGDYALLYSGDSFSNPVDLTSALYTAEAYSGAIQPGGGETLLAFYGGEGDQKVYLAVDSGTVGNPYNKSAAPIVLKKSTAGDGRFLLEEKNANGTYKALYFHFDATDDSGRKFDRAGENLGLDHEAFVLLTPNQVDGETPVEGLPGYYQVTDLSQVKQGNQYLIGHPADGKTSYYFLYPSSQDVANAHVAKYVHYIDESFIDYYLSVKALKVGVQDLWLGGVTHRFIVEDPKIVDVELNLDQEVHKGNIPHRTDEKTVDGTSVAAELKEEQSTGIEIIQGQLDGFTGNPERGRNALYKFESNGPGQYDIVSEEYPGMHFHLRNSSPGCPNTSEVGNWEIKALDNMGNFSLHDISSSKYLYMYTDNSRATIGQLDQNSTPAGDNTTFQLYTRDNVNTNIETGYSEDLPGYYQVTSEDQIVPGVSYLIAKKIGDAIYVAHPSESGTKLTHVAKVSGETKQYTDYYLEVTPLEVGKTDVTVEGVMYRFHVVKLDSDTHLQVQDTQLDVTVQDGVFDDRSKVFQAAIVQGLRSSSVAEEDEQIIKDAVSDAVKESIDEPLVRDAVTKAGIVDNYEEQKDSIRIIAEPYVEITPEKFEHTGTSWTLQVDISAWYRTIATTAPIGTPVVIKGEMGGGDPNAAIIGESHQEVSVVDPIHLRIAIAEDMAKAFDQEVYIKHTKDEAGNKWHYHKGELDAAHILTFESTDGLSPFVISNKLDIVAYNTTTKEYYESLQDAIDEAKDGDLIELWDLEQTAVVNWNLFVILKDRDGNGIANKLKPGENVQKVTDEDGVYVFAEYGETLFIMDSENGTVSATPEAPKPGEKVTLNVSPETGYLLQSLKINDKNGNPIEPQLQPDGSYTFTMPDDFPVYVRATFSKEPEPAPTLDIVIVGSGTVTANPERPEAGQTVTLTVEAAGDNRLDSIYATPRFGGDSLELKDNGDGTYTFTMPDDDSLLPVVVVATFVPEEHQENEETVLIKYTGNGAGTVKASSYYAEPGETVTLTAQAGARSIFADLTITDAKGTPVPYSETENGVFVFVMPESTPVTVTANFKLNQGGGGSSGSSGSTKPTPPEPSVPDIDRYVDVVPGSWYVDGITYCVTHDLMTGTSDTTFEPFTATTRAMLATILYNIEGRPAAGQSGFADVPSGAWFADSVAWARTMDIVAGYSDTEFGPNDPLTREQVAVILYNYARIKGYDISGQADLSKYTDLGTVHDWALTAMRWAVSVGLITGTSDTTLSPIDSANRAQIATILMNYCQRVAGMTE